MQLLNNYHTSIMLNQVTSYVSPVIHNEIWYVLCVLDVLLRHVCVS